MIPVIRGCAWTTRVSCGSRSLARPATAARRACGAIVDGRIEAGYTGVFELICCQCGDHPYLDYAEISHRLQRIRGPYTIEAGLAAYAQHLADRLRY